MALDNDFIDRNFLAPDGQNFDQLLRTIQSFNQAIPAAPNRARRPGAERISYTNNDINWAIPRVGLDDAALAKAVQRPFAGAIQWQSPLAMVNVTPSPAFASIAAMTMANLYNQNALWDFTSGAFLQIEKQIVAGLGGLLADYDSSCGGTATSGGKAAMAYAVKLGVNRSEPEAVVHGIRKRHLIFASACAHYSIEWTLNQLGLGTSACVRIPCDNAGRMFITSLEARLREALADGYCISAIILSGADTIDHIIDPIDEVVKLVNSLLSTLKMPHRPFLYVDLVSGWIWRLFRGYDFVANSLSLTPADARYVRHKLAELASLSQVDGFGVDLHKTGLCPYGSSFFVCQYGNELRAINCPQPVQGPENFGELHAHHFTFENSRTTAGIAAAWAALNQLGLEGLRSYAVKLMQINGLVTDALADWTDDFKILARPDSWRAPLFTLAFEDQGIASDAQVHQFHHTITELVCKGAAGVPQIGLVPEYKIPGRPASAALMAYPMSLFMTKSTARAAVMALLSIKRKMKRRTVVESAVSNPEIPPR